MDCRVKPDNDEGLGRCHPGPRPGIQNKSSGIPTPTHPCHLGLFNDAGEQTRGDNFSVLIGDSQNEVFFYHKRVLAALKRTVKPNECNLFTNRAQDKGASLTTYG